MNTTQLYSHRPNLILGFHGCDQAVCDKIVSHREEFRPSENQYDWLGSGVYFWENNYLRALEWAQWAVDHPEQTSQKVESPAVVGAVISLDYCFDLLDSRSIELLQQAHTDFVKAWSLEYPGQPLPQNILGKDRQLRHLDCAVINYTHHLLAKSGLEPFDSVRAMFTEGEPIYPTSGFRLKSHIQICIRNSNSIKGVFLPRNSAGMLVSPPGFNPSLS